MPLPSEMNEILAKVDDVFAKMESLHRSTEQLHENAEKRQEMWERLIQEQTNNNKERLANIDKRWNILMRTVIFFLGLFLISAVKDTMSIRDRPTEEAVIEMIDKKDYSTKSEVLRGVGSVIDDVYETIERETDMTHDEATAEKELTKIRMGRQVTNYNPRGIK